jgi:hypothetical protein
VILFLPLKIPIIQTSCNDVLCYIVFMFIALCIKGAMENWGLVTFREVDLLIDPIKASNSQKQRVCVVVAHELAHQWFGKLECTMYLAFHRHYFCLQAL